MSLRIFAEFTLGRTEGATGAPAGLRMLFWSTEAMMNHVDTVWPWSLMDFTGRPDRRTPPQRFTSEFLKKNYLNK